MLLVIFCLRAGFLSYPFQKAGNFYNDALVGAFTYLLHRVPGLDMQRHPAALYRKHFRVVFVTALRLLASRAEAEDAAQDAFIIAFRDVGSIRDPGAIGAWLLRIAVRQGPERTQVELAAQRPAFYVHLAAPGLAGRFSDSCFALLPGHPRVVEFLPAAGAKATGAAGAKPAPEPALEKILRVRHLRASYQKSGVRS